MKEKVSKIFISSIVLIFLISCKNIQQQQENEVKTLVEAFQHPPGSARPWVLWDWINCNISREGITNDLESMKRVGIGGVVWRGLAGPWWAPEGKITPYSDDWHSHMQWAIQEAERLDIEFDISIDYGYGSGGPHITPDNSMQKLYWNKKIIDGGGQIDIPLEKPNISKENIEKAWLPPGKQLNDKVVNEINKINSYRDIAILAIPYEFKEHVLSGQTLDVYTGLSDENPYNNNFLTLDKLSSSTKAVPVESIIDLSNMKKDDGTIQWNAPPGKWLIMRLGHASNFKMTRPSPPDAVGLECNRLSKKGIEAHFNAFLKPILEKASTKSGKTLKYVFLDSWEAGGQNWTDELPVEFRTRRGYDIFPWLPALTGHMVESPELTDRFLWDFRQTISEMTLDNYHQHLRDMISPYSVQYSVEAYGNLCVNQLDYAEVGDFLISEFWTLGEDRFPEFENQRKYSSMKAMASPVHTKGDKRIGAEAFTGARGWKDHPFSFKGMGDEAFCQGVNQFILHLSAHQAYDNMIPGLTHRKWGGHFNRHNTWWEFSKPWFDYLTRSQFMLQQGNFVADVCYFFGEGAPLSVHNMKLELPKGYDYDFCSSNTLQQMEVDDGKILLPSGMSYRYLLLPNNDKLTLVSVKKIRELVESGAHVIAQKRVVGTPGLSDYPEADAEVQDIISQLWDQKKIITEDNWEKIIQKEKIQPDFEGIGLNYIHRKLDEVDIYFIANPEPDFVETECSFRVSGKIPELWNPETGDIRELPEFKENNGRTSIALRFNPFQSWFVVFRNTKSINTAATKNFPENMYIADINGPWQVTFNPDWGGPVTPVTFDTLQDWSQHINPEIHFYSGTATYQNTFSLPASQNSQSYPLLIDLGHIEVIAQVKVNGKNCGITWKPPYRIDISHAIQPGKNNIEINVVNTWVNRMIGDEQLPEDCNWLNWETLEEWPEWFLKGTPRPSGRYTFTTAKHYKKDDPLLSSGLLGPVSIYKEVNN